MAKLRAREDLDKDMGKINEGVTAILEEQHARRVALLKRNEDVTRETVDVEVDIRRLETMQEQSTVQVGTLNEQRVDLEGNRRRLQRDVGDLDRDDVALKDENGKLGGERGRLDEEVGRLKKLRQDYLGAISKFKGEKEGLGT